MTTEQYTQELLGLENKLFGFALKLTGNNNDAKDLVQETFLKALSKKDSFKDDSNLKAWVSTIMKNLFINNYRKKQLVNVLDDSANFHILFSTSKPMKPDSIIHVTEIKNEIKSISGKNKEPFLMYISGYKYEEISDIMDIPLGTIKSRIFLARKRLMNNLKDFR